MNIKTIKNDRDYFWTNHSKYKLLEYNVSPNIVKLVIKSPERIEEGVAPETIAVMKRKDTKKTQREIWVMYQKNKKKKAQKTKHISILSRMKIISVWIYPGTSPKGKEIFIPDDVWEIINENK